MTSAAFDLQPMSTGDILDRSVRLYRRDFLHILAIVSTPYIVFIPLWALVGTGEWHQGQVPPWTNPVIVIGYPLFGLAYLWLTAISMGALARSVSERFLGGSPTIWGVYAPVLRLTVPLIWAYLLSLLAAGAVLAGGSALFVAALFVARQGRLSGYIFAATLGLCALAAIVCAVGIFFRSFLITQVVAIEDIRGWASVRRSWKLMRSGRNKAGLILLFGIAVSFVITFLINIPAGIMLAMWPGWPMLIVGKALESVGQILSTPFMMIGFTLLYYDSRIRQEAFDLEVMAQHLGAARPSPSVAK